jgi:hypothetical protein
MVNSLQLADGIQPSKLAKTNNNRIHFRRKQIIEN